MPVKLWRIQQRIDTNIQFTRFGLYQNGNSDNSTFILNFNRRKDRGEEFLRFPRCEFQIVMVCHSAQCIKTRNPLSSHRKIFREINFLVSLHSVEITEFYCHEFVAKIPSNQLFTKELFSKLIWRKKLRGSTVW